ncbi:MAG: HU family DNA-binding protein, partial [Clostridia bacterium]|nr:HU family DNA-binding protein [Clostridia bacterium]
MNKTELIDAVAAKTNITKKDTEATINALVEAIQEDLQSGSGKVQLIGFGTF